MISSLPFPTGPLYKDPRNHQPPDQHPARRDVRPPAAEHLQDGRGAGRLAGSEPSQPELAPIEPSGATAGNAAGDPRRTVAPPPRSPVDRYVTLGFPSTIVIRKITAPSLHPYPYSKQRAAVYSPKQYASYSSASPNSLTHSLTSPVNEVCTKRQLTRPPIVISIMLCDAPHKHTHPKIATF